MRTGDDRVRDFYDQVMYSDLADRFNQGSGFQDYGYWTPATVHYREAADNLMVELLDLAPGPGGPEETDEPTDILDVACGQGATTAWLAARFPGARITGINISEKQLATCRTVAPDATFLLMDATELDLPDASVDLVTCVEAAFHFEPRVEFLREALRVLRPGGSLVLSDILFDLPQASAPYPAGNANRVDGPEDYARRLTRIGYDAVRVVDATDQCWHGFLRAARGFAVRAAGAGEIPAPVARDLLRRLRRRELITRYYLLAGARRPDIGR